MTIRRRIALSFIAILFFFGVSQAIALWSGRLRARSIETYGRALTRQVIIVTLRRDLDNLQKEVQLLGEIEVPQGERGGNQETQADFNRKVDDVSGYIQELRSLAEPDSRPMLDDMEQTYDRLAESWKGFYEYLRAEPSFALAYALRAEPISRRLLADLVPPLERQLSERALAARGEFDSVARLTSRVSLVILAVTTLLAFGVAFRISRYIGSGMTELKKEAELIGAGRLEHRISVRSKDEIADVGRAFNDMAEKLLYARGELTRANEELSELNRILEARVEEQIAKIRLASRIQLDLLPKSAPVVPGYDIAGRTVPAQIVGGDYFDFITIDDQRLAICLGDVSGKGLPASLLMANLQATVRGQSLVSASASACLKRSNTLLFRSTDTNRYATVFYAVLDRTAHRLCYANAGHNPPLLLCDSKPPVSLEAGGMPVGLMEDASFQEGSVSIEPGDILVIYSDGIVEATNGDEEEFGEGRLALVVRQHRTDPAEALLEAILDEVRRHSGDRPQADDMTLIVLKR